MRRKLAIIIAIFLTLTLYGCKEKEKEKNTFIRTKITYVTYFDSDFNNSRTNALYQGTNYELVDESTVIYALCDESGEIHAYVKEVYNSNNQRIRCTIAEDHDFSLLGSDEIMEYNSNGDLIKYVNKEYVQYEVEYEDTFEYSIDNICNSNGEIVQKNIVVSKHRDTDPYSETRYEVWKYEDVNNENGNGCVEFRYEADEFFNIYDDTKWDEKYMIDKNRNYTHGMGYPTESESGKKSGGYVYEYDLLSNVLSK